MTSLRKITLEAEMGSEMEVKEITRKQFQPPGDKEMRT